MNSIMLSKINIQGRVGDVCTIEASIHPTTEELKVRFIPDNPNVVEIITSSELINKAVVYLKEVGTAKITALLENGDKISEDCIVTVEPAVKIEEKQFDELRFFFGDLHAHTRYSDGKENGSPAELYKIARESRLGDFATVSDHAGSVGDIQWFDTLKQSEIYTEDGVFIAIPAYESGAPGGSYEDHFGMQVNNGGELVGFGTPWIIRPHDVNTYDKLKEIYGRYPRAFVQYPHPQEAGWPTEWIWNAYNLYNFYDAEMDKLAKLIEVENRSSEYRVLHEYAYIKVLDAGWHLSPVAVTDSHRGGTISKYPDRTVILAPKLTQQHLFDAIRDHRVYATNGSQTELIYKINGQWMGRTLDANVEEYHFEITINDPDEIRITNIEIVSDYGEVVYSENPNSCHFTIDIKLNSSISRYYYVRVVNEKGDKTWSSPIWTGRAPDPILPESRGVMVEKSSFRILSATCNGADKLYDNNPRSAWEIDKLPGEVVIDMGKTIEITGFGYYRHQVEYDNDSAINKLLKDYEIYVSIDGESWIKAANGMIQLYGKERYINIKPTQARYFKLRALTAIQGSTAAIGEFTVYASHKE